MRTSSHSPFATALLLIPILTVPLLAIFGVPQIMPVVPKALEERHRAQSANADAAEFVPGPARNWQDFGDPPPPVAAESGDSAWPELLSDSTARTVAERRAEGQRRTTSTGPFAKDRDSILSNAPTESVAALIAPVAQPTGESASLREPALPRPSMELGYKRSPQVAQAAIAVPARMPRNPTALPVEALTWNEAVRRLNDLEIRNFRLEPGQQSEQFVFICSYTLPDNPRVSYRFEAEADEPLRAVEKVLAQIDAWLAAK